MRRAVYCYALKYPSRRPDWSGAAIRRVAGRGQGGVHAFLQSYAKALAVASGELLHHALQNVDTRLRIEGGTGEYNFVGLGAPDEIPDRL